MSYIDDVRARTASAIKKKEETVLPKLLEWIKHRIEDASSRGEYDVDICMEYIHIISPPPASPRDYINEIREVFESAGFTVTGERGSRWILIDWSHPTKTVG